MDQRKMTGDKNEEKESEIFAAAAVFKPFRCLFKHLN